MSFFSNAVRLIRRKKDSQGTQDAFDISDNLPKVSEKDKSAKAAVASRTPLSNAWTTALPDTPVQSDFRPVYSSEAFSTRINQKHFTPTYSHKDSLADASPLDGSVSNLDAPVSKKERKTFWKTATQVFKFKKHNDDNVNNIVEKIEANSGDNFSQTKINKEQDADMTSTNLEADFSLRNYAKESFSVMIVRPISSCMHKILRASYFAITGVLVGGLIALITCLIALQFGSVENSVISAYLLNKIEMVLPNSDISVKSAMLQWNSEAGSVEICLNKVRFEEFFFPKVAILPNYTESFKNWKFVADTISIVKPKVTLHVADDFKTVFIDPNLIKTKHHKPVLEPFSTLVNMKNGFIGNGIMHKDATFKLINADVSVVENGQSWDAQNLFCEYKLGDSFPRVLDFRSVLPGQKYASSIRMAKFSNDLGYDLKINSVNPAVIYDTFIERNTPIEKFLPLIQGYNLPISGDAKIFLNPDQSFKDCSFNILASKGSIRLPNRNSLALNLGKRIDNGSISGSITENRMNFDTINISYGNSGVQLTGLSIPVNNSDLVDTANIDGTLSLTNVNLDEVYGMLPKSMSKPVLSVFHDYLPGFRLDLLKFDLKGPISFKDKGNIDKLDVSQGVFKVRGAQIPVNGELVATDVDATGTVKHDGFDLKVSNAKLGKSKINSGVFFISNKDNSWIGKVNVNLPVEELQKYVPLAKTEVLPFKKLEIEGDAKLDVKLVRLAKDKFGEQDLPFKITEGAGVVCSEDNARKLRFSWNKEGTSAVADITNGKHSTHLELTEDLAKKKGTTQLHCIGNSGFLADMIPFISKDLRGDFDLTLNKAWDESGERADLSIDLANATLNLPVLGQVKGVKESGKFSTHIQKYPDRITLSQIVLETPKTKLTGHVTTDKDWNITECVLDNISMDGISARANIFKKDDKKLILSLVGDSFDAHKLTGLMNQAKDDVKLVTYLNMKQMRFNGNDLKNIKGTVDILGGKIVDGSCIGTLGDSTLALNTKPLEGTDDHIVSISSSDAEKFLKTFGIGNSLDGGSITFSMKSSDIAKGVVSGDFEMNNFLVKNNLQLMRLITLSSPNYMNGMQVIIGFNTCTGHLELVDGKVKFDNLRAVSPTIAISLNGEYDRLNDEMNAAGMVMPMASLNSLTSDGCTAAEFSVAGSFWNPNLSVSTPRVIELENLQNAFGNSVPQLNGGAATVHSNNIVLGRTANIRPVPEEEFSTVKIVRGTPDAIAKAPNVQDPFANNSFDRAAAAMMEEGREGHAMQVPIIEQKAVKVSPADTKLKKIKNNFGVKIKRGNKRKSRSR